MSVVEVLETARFADEAAARISLSLPGEGTVVITGGTTAARLYEPLAAADAGWGSLDVYFSDERCVPPGADASNFAMARRLLLDRVAPRRVHRMEGERDPADAAAAYHDVVASTAAGGFDLVLLGMGGDCHIAALFPGSPAVDEVSELCVAVDRPDGLKGLTLTPPALQRGREILVLVSGAAKGEAVRRAVGGDEPPRACPARLLADHPNVTFVLDEAAAARL